MDLSVRCSSGTYVRAIARDLGAALGVGGHLTALRRTAVGPFTLDDARTLDDLADGFAMVDISDVARRCFPSYDLDADGAPRRRASAARSRSTSAGTGDRSPSSPPEARSWPSTGRTARSPPLSLSSPADWHAVPRD